MRSLFKVVMFVVYIGLIQTLLITKNKDYVIQEEKYTELCPEFKGTYVEEVYNIVRSKFNIGRMRFLMKAPSSCLSWHRDQKRRLHIPIITNVGNIMVIEDTAFHMPSDERDI